MKNIALLLVCAEDTLLNPDNENSKVYQKEALRANLVHVLNLHKGPVVDVATRQRNQALEVLDGVRQQSIISYTVNSQSFNHEEDDMVLRDLELDPIHMRGNQLDFVLPPKDFDIHIAGIDMNGMFKGIIERLLDLGYSVVLYNDAARSVADTHKFAITMNKQNPKFRYMSYKSVKQFNK